MNTEELLSERQKTHGSFVDQAKTAQALKRVMCLTPNWQNMPPYMREGIELICTKMARMGHGDWQEADHPRDGSGYFELIVEGLWK